MNKKLRFSAWILGLVAVGSLLVFAGTASARSSDPGNARAAVVQSAECPPSQRQGWMPSGWERMRAWLAKHPRASVRIRNAFANRMPDLEISAEEALEIAQDYLDENQPGAVAEAAARPGLRAFYHFIVIVDDEVVGRLHVNGQSGEVFEPPAAIPEECL